MKLLQLIFILSFALIVKTSPSALAAAAAVGNDDILLFGEVPEFSISRFPMEAAFPMKPKPNTCEKHPEICRRKGSPGPDCCHKNCVNLRRDIWNCGSCGHKCKPHQICCDFKCVNYLTDSANCGRCHHKCKRGHKCVYGICNYA